MWGRFFRGGDYLVILLRAKTQLSRRYWRAARWKRGINGLSFVVGHGLWRHCRKLHVPLLHLVGQFLVKGVVTDVIITCKGSCKLLIQWPHHVLIIYPVVGHESDKCLCVSNELLEKTSGTTLL
jgi:hypothetical protein